MSNSIPPAPFQELFQEATSIFYGLYSNPGLIPEVDINTDWLMSSVKMPVPSEVRSQMPEISPTIIYLATRTWLRTNTEMSLTYWINAPAIMTASKHMPILKELSSILIFQSRPFATTKYWMRGKRPVYTDQISHITQDQILSRPFVWRYSLVNGIPNTIRLEAPYDVE